MAPGGTAGRMEWHETVRSDTSRHATRALLIRWPQVRILPGAPQNTRSCGVFEDSARGPRRVWGPGVLLVCSAVQGPYRAAPTSGALYPPVTRRPCPGHGPVRHQRPYSRPIPRPCNPVAPSDRTRPFQPGPLTLLGFTRHNLPHGQGEADMRQGVVLNDRYRLDSRLGHGGMGQVWCALDLTLDRFVAIKLVLDHESEELEHRLRREGRAAARLDHPSIAKVFDIGRHDEHVYLVLELLQGEDLGRILTGRTRGLDLGSVLDIGAQVAEGLSAAHRAGVIHRDIKPANLFRTSDGRVKICDFGIAWLDNATHGLTRGALGSLPYMAPERFDSRPVGTRTDLYALGCTLYELLTLEPPFTGDMPAVIHGHVNRPPRPLSAQRKDAPEQLDHLLHELLAKDPSERPRNALEVAERLRGIPFDAGKRSSKCIGIDLGTTNSCVAVLEGGEPT
ncbi:serine/threonine-protein kinase, partial [Nocardiopsis tropica]|uniref:serine/threonine-protein kinase n=1 Tax=Nocardiopsis tropica TaxID=109330 RepID=UPI0031DE1AA8